MVVPFTDVGWTGGEAGLKEKQDFCLQHSQRDQVGTESGA